MHWIPVLYRHEHYECPFCATDLLSHGISDSWKCQTCTTTVSVFAEDHKGRKQVLNRLRPSELREKFLVVMPGSGLEYVYAIISIVKQETGFRLALRGYGVVRCPQDALIECVVGSW